MTLRTIQARLLLHKPDCARFDARTLRVGGARVCRGCASLWSGVAVGVAAAAALAATCDATTCGAAGALSGFALLCAGMAGLRARWYARLPNACRDLSRFSLGAAPVVFAMGSLRAGWWYPGAVVLWLCAFVTWRAMVARRGRPPVVCGECHRCRERSARMAARAA